MLLTPAYKICVSDSVVFQIFVYLCRCLLTAFPRIPNKNLPRYYAENGDDVFTG